MPSSAPAPAARGQLFVLSAPSGTGKTTIVARLRKAGVVGISVSYTTRPPRPDETSGEAYFFVSEGEFFQMREGGEFLEWAQVYGNYYGTSRAWVEKHLAKGENVLLEIDCQGAERIRELNTPAVMIFLSPPDFDTLRRRLVGRNDDVDEETLKRRLAAAEGEMAQQSRFDHVIINDDLERAVAEVAALIGSTSSPSPSPTSTR